MDLLSSDHWFLSNITMLLELAVKLLFSSVDILKEIPYFMG